MASVQLVDSATSPVTSDPPSPAAPSSLVPAIDNFELPFAARNARFVNRDLSWLYFNARVLHAAEDSRTPLLERVRFLQIFTANLDEFFMKRVGFLKRQVMLGVDGVDGSGLTVREVLTAIRQIVLAQLRSQVRCWSHEVEPALARQGIYVVGWDELYDRERVEV